MKRNALFYPVAVILLSLLFAAGCSDDDTRPKFGNVTDIDGNEYKTVTIGNQIWMAENLRVTKYRDGSELMSELNHAEWQSTTEGAFAIYDHTDEAAEGLDSPEEMVDAYGKLYNWYAIADERGLCPEGWRIPLDEDWTKLVDFVVSRGHPNETPEPEGAGNALKSTRSQPKDHPRWMFHTIHAGYDNFGFAALPAGRRHAAGVYDQIGRDGLWWSATERSEERAWFRGIHFGTGDVYRTDADKANGFSVRCIK